MITVQDLPPRLHIMLYIKNETIVSTPTYFIFRRGAMSSHCCVIPLINTFDILHVWICCPYVKPCVVVTKAPTLCVCRNPGNLLLQCIVWKYWPANMGKIVVVTRRVAWHTRLLVRVNFSIESQIYKSL